MKWKLLVALLVSVIAVLFCISGCRAPAPRIANDHTLSCWTEPRAEQAIDSSWRT